MAVKTNQEYPRGPEGNRLRADRDQDARRQDPRADARSRRSDGRAQDGRGASSPPSRRRSTPSARAAAPSTARCRRRSSGSPPSAPTLVGGLDQQVLAHVRACRRKRNGVAVAEARDGICTICHVRLRPQVFNTVRRNEEIMQCDSCNRILYFVPRAGAGRRAGRVAPAGIVTRRRSSGQASPSTTPRDRAGRRVHRRRRARQSRPGRLRRPRRATPTARWSRSSASRSASRPTTSPSTAGCSPRSSGRRRHGHRAAARAIRLAAARAADARQLQGEERRAAAAAREGAPARARDRPRHLRARRPRARTRTPIASPTPRWTTPSR